MSFSQTSQIYLADTDAAGILFYPQLFRLAQQTFELYLSAKELNLKQLIQDDLLMPVVHAQADYRAPLYLGDSIEIHMGLHRLGRRSLILDYQFSRDAQKVAFAQVTHVYLKKDTFSATEWPEKWREFWGDLGPIPNLEHSFDRANF